MARPTDPPEPQTVDTIAAVSTPPGEGGIGIIRISGPEAIPLAGRIFRRPDGSRLTDPCAFRLYYGHIRHPETGEILDEVLLGVMRAPHSFTREDVVEINAHGGPVPLRAILALCCDQGARPAHPGEFTQRAFLNGRIDLTQAEAVLDTIRARTDAGLRAAQQVLQGKLGQRIRGLRARLISLLASLEAAIDFSEDELTFLTPAEIGAELQALREEVVALVATHTRGKLLREGARTVIIGRPNTGKSSLLNTLLGESRAIVTAVPGTTRDVIEEQWEIGGVPLRLQDTAGIRHTEDVVERIGVERSRSYLAQADLILLVVDRTQPLTNDDRELLDIVRDRPTILVLNKSDLPARVTPADLCPAPHTPVVELSAVTGEGIAHLTREIGALLLGPAVAVESVMLANVRQRNTAVRARDALDQALQTHAQGGSEELLAVDLMDAAAALGEISGENVRDAILDDLFARFCVGK